MSKILLQIGTTDLTPYIKSYKIDYNVLVKDDGRNASGNATINIINRKSKLNVVFRPTSEAEMATILAAIGSFVVSVNHWDVKSQSQLTKTMYVNTPSPDFYTNRNETGLFNELPLNFIEL